MNATQGGLIAHDAENAVLGGLMLDNLAFDKVAAFLKQSDFSTPERRAVYMAIEQCANRNAPFDLVTLAEVLNGHTGQESALAYLGALAKNTPSAANVVHYARIVRDKSICRELQKIGGELRELAQTSQPTPEKIDAAQAAVQRLTETATYSGPVPASEALEQSIDALERRVNNADTITGLATGFHGFDDLTMGMNPGELYVIAARPGMGKTTFAMNLASSAFLDNVSVLVFSMEMTGRQLLDRSLCSLGGVDFAQYRKGELSDADWTNITSAGSKLNAAPLYIDETPDRSPMQVRAIARRHKREHGLGLIIIDYLQLMRAEGENRTTQISEITRSLKSLAKELHVPVVALSQLNREVDKRPNKRPVMSDLRESGSIEQDADVVAFIYRDEVYDADSRDKGIAEVCISKHRNGETGTIRLGFNGRHCKFFNL